MINLIAKKIGMSHIYKESGEIVPFTMVKLYDNCVLAIDINQDKGFDNILIGFDKVLNNRKISKPIAGTFLKKNLPLHKNIYGCRVEKNSNHKVGDIIVVDSILKQGDFIDVSGISTGKGFAGVMKRHNFSGIEASHGVSVSHRSHGSTGQRQDPGKVFKGKKMAGHMGCRKVNVQNLQIVKIDSEKGLLIIKGCVPGFKGGKVFVTDAKKKTEVL